MKCVGCNNFSDLSASKIAKLVSRDQWLAAISLRDCNMAEEGMRELLDSVRDNTWLISLVLDGNAETAATDKILKSLDKELSGRVTRDSMPSTITKQQARLLDSIGFHDSIEEIEVAVEVGTCSSFFLPHCM